VDRILHFMRDGAKEFFVKRMPKEFESEFNLPASMLRDHLIIFENLWSHGQDDMKGQPPYWSFNFLSKSNHSFCDLTAPL